MRPFGVIRVIRGYDPIFRSCFGVSNQSAWHTCRTSTFRSQFGEPAFFQFDVRISFPAYQGGYECAEIRLMRLTGLAEVFRR